MLYNAVNITLSSFNIFNYETATLVLSAMLITHRSCLRFITCLVGLQINMHSVKQIMI